MVWILINDEWIPHIYIPLHEGFSLMVMVRCFLKKQFFFLGEKVGNLIKSNESPHKIHGRQKNVSTLMSSKIQPFMDSAHKDDLGTSCPLKAIPIHQNCHGVYLNTPESTPNVEVNWLI